MTDAPTPVTLGDIPRIYADPDPSMLAKLPKPLSKNAEKGTCDVCGKWHGLPAIHLDYVGHADLTLALLAIDPEWDWAPAAVNPTTGGPVITQEGGRLVMWATLTVLGKSRLGVGTCEATKGDPEKELIGDFLRNAAMRFGIATRLWSKADRADPAGTDEAGGYERRSGGSGGQGGSQQRSGGNQGGNRPQGQQAQQRPPQSSGPQSIEAAALATIIAELPPVVWRDVTRAFRQQFGFAHTAVPTDREGEALTWASEEIARQTEEQPSPDDGTGYP